MQIDNSVRLTPTKNLRFVHSTQNYLLLQRGLLLKIIPFLAARRTPHTTPAAPAIHTPAASNSKHQSSAGGNGIVLEDLPPRPSLLARRTSWYIAGRGSIDPPRCTPADLGAATTAPAPRRRNNFCAVVVVVVAKMMNEFKE